MSLLTNPLFLLGLFLLGGLSWYLRRRKVGFFDPYKVQKKAMRLLPVQPIAQAGTQQPVRIVGRARKLDGVQLLTAPASGRPCLAWRITVEQIKQRGGRQRRVTVLDQSYAVAMAIEDATGHAAVNPHGMRLLLDVDAKKSSGWFSSPTPELQRMLAAQGISTKDIIGSKSLVFREGVITEGERIALGGLGGWEAGPGSRLVLQPLPDGTLPVSDHAAVFH